MRVGCKSGSRTGPALSTEGPVRLRRHDAQVHSRRARTSVLFLVHEVFCEALQQSTPVPIVGPEPAPYSIRGPRPGGRFWPVLAAREEFALGCQLQNGRFRPIEAVIDNCNLAPECGGGWRTRLGEIGGKSQSGTVTFCCKSSHPVFIQYSNRLELCYTVQCVQL